jgi:glycosyltransferase involved in cell wall biosynthesis
VLQALAARDVPFRIAICGAGRPELPKVLASRTIHLGRVEDRQEYWALLGRCHIVVSTAVHEFFGVSVLEAVHAGARPVVPDRLAYRETLPAEYRHATEEELLARLERLCRGWATGEIALRRDRAELVNRYRSESVVPIYAAALTELAAR